MDTEKYDPIKSFRLPKQAKKHLDELKREWGQKNDSQVIIQCIYKMWAFEIGNKRYQEITRD